MKKTLTVLLALLVGQLYLAGKVFLLPDILKPFRVYADNDRIYITAGPEIFIFDGTDGRLVKKFGKAGEGPREFKLYPEYAPELDISAAGILVSSIGKISLFSANGDFKWEKKVTGVPMDQFNRLLGNRIAGLRVLRDGDTMYQALNIYDSELENKREIHRHKYYLQRPTYNPISRGLYISNFYVYRGEIYVGGEIGSGAVHVYDREGKALRTLRPTLDPVPFTNKDKQGFIDSYLTNDEYRQIYERIKNTFVYPDIFPLYQNFIVADGRIYLQTFKRNEAKGTNEVVISDLNGNILKKVWLPFVEYFDFTPNPYTFHSGKLYQVVENEETEEWELHVTEIE